jgi:hypothetical protein
MNPPELRRPPWWVVAFELGFLLALPALAIAWFDNPTVRAALPDPVGPIPLGVIFFGALGGVVIGNFGVFFHEDRWSDRYDLWHTVRPFVGGTLGAVSYLVMVVVIQATGSTTQPKGNLAYYLVAFIAGYSEDTFRKLMKQAMAKLLPDPPPAEGASKPGKTGVSNAP